MTGRRSVCRRFLTRGLAALLLAGCAPADLSDLPPLPEVDTGRFLSGVAAQLDAAFAAAADDPGDPARNGRLGMMLQTYKQFAAAEVLYRRARALDPGAFDWTYLHATVLEALGRRDEAIVALREALAQDPHYVHARLRLAALLAERGDTVEAGALYDAVLAAGTAPPEAYFGHGKFLLDRGETDQAIAAFDETLRQSGPLGVAYYQLGLAWRKKGDTDRAAEYFALAKRHEGYSADSSDPLLNRLLPLNLSEQPFVHRAKVLAENGRLDEAQRFIAMALERNPDSVAAHASMIGLAARLGRFEEADRHARQALAIDPDNAKVHFNLGMARIAEQRYVEATRAFETSIGLDPTDPNAHVQLAVLRHRAGRAGAAERSLLEALDLDPLHPLGNWLLGELWHERGRSADAVGPLGKAARQDHPMRALIYAALAQAQAATGAMDAARESLANARRAAAERPEAGFSERLAAVAAEIDALDGGADAQHP